MEKVQRAVTAYAEREKLRSLRFVGRGLEAAVWFGVHSEWGSIALKVYLNPDKTHPNAYLVSTEEVASSEGRAMQAAYSAGLPVPRVFEITVQNGYTISAQSFLEGGHPKSIPGHEIGQLIRTLHDKSNGVHQLVAMEQPSLRQTLCQRTLDRLAHLVKVHQDYKIPRVDGEMLYDSLEDYSRHVLLHMDIRPSNVLVSQSSVTGILDWSNALIGPASLEFARLKMYGHFSLEFLDGYGVDPTEEVSHATYLAYELDTLAMLGVVHSAESSDPRALHDVISRLVDTITKWKEACHG